MTEYTFQADFTYFTTEDTQYHGENALFLADCAKLGYETPDVIKQAMQTQLGFSNFEFFTIEKNTQGFVAGNDKVIIVAFRGTEKKLRDFLADAKLSLKPGPAGKIHHGFKDGLDEVWGENLNNSGMKAYIRQCQDNNQAIYFCGHSLGAALTTLAAADYVINNNQSVAGSVKGIYTIGQPRVGNRTFASSFDKALGNRCFRIVNNNDVVTHIPVPGLFLKYQHVGREIYIDNTGKLVGSLPWWKKFIDQIEGIQDDLLDLGLDALKDHSSEDYVKLLNDNRSVPV